MQCRLLRGLAGALLTLLCMGLLSLRYHLRLSPKSVETPGLSPLSPRLHELQLRDIFIAVKTTGAFHRSRLELLLDTWVSRTREQVTRWSQWAPGVAWAFLLGWGPSQPRGRSGLPTPPSSRTQGILWAGLYPWPRRHCSSGLLLWLFQAPGWAPAQASGSLLGIPLSPACSGAGFSPAQPGPAWHRGQPMVGSWGRGFEGGLADMTPTGVSPVQALGAVSP